MNLRAARRLTQVLILAMVLAGCRGGRKPTPTVAPTMASTPTTAATQAAAGGTTYPGPGVGKPAATELPTAAYNPYPGAGEGKPAATEQPTAVYNPYPAASATVPSAAVTQPTTPATVVAQAPATPTYFYNPYPGAGTANPGNTSPPPPFIYNPYPGQGTGTPNPAAGGQATPTPRFGGTLTAAAATSTARVNGGTAFPSAGSATARPGASGTPGPRPTPTNSFPTSTPTATLPPAPPTSTPALPTTPDAYRLHATDPATVKLAAGKVQLVWFFAFWSGRCQELAPMVAGLQDHYQGNVIFTYLDIDDPATLTFRRTLGFRVEPQFFLLDAKGKVLKQWSGQATADQMIGDINAALR